MKKYFLKNHRVSSVIYHKIHHWLRTEFGKANKCENENCPSGSSYFEWSLRSGKEYEMKKENFWMLCRRCHAKMDITEETIRRCREARAKNEYFKNRYFNRWTGEWFSIA